ncbi:hypothetical protein [Enterococcus sp. AZ154]|uniref:hypothetical protein n=1 Tax=Enterococcus sp. AZ154 TaxID=2774683 RepID=UPI003D2E54DB
MNGLLKRLKEERIQGSSAVLNYSNFDYWVNWDDIVDIVEDHDQPQLNENQQIVLEWLKSTWIDRKKNCWFPFEVINSLYYQFDVAWGKVSYEEFKRIEKDKPYIKAYGELTALEQFEVLEVFSRWAQD